MSRNGKRNLSYEKRKFDEVQNWYGTFWHNYRTSTIWRICLDEETQGLIHVSEVQAGFTKNIHGLLTVGQKVTVRY